MRDRVASWFVGLPITWRLAELGWKPAHLLPLCIAHSLGVRVRWHHLSGRSSINDRDEAESAEEGGGQDA